MTTIVRQLMASINCLRDGKSGGELERATYTLRELSAQHPTITLPAFVELKALPSMLTLLQRIREQPDKPDGQPSSPRQGPLEPLEYNLWVALANGSVYAPARPIIQKYGGVDLAATLLEQSPEQLEVALALLQNLSLHHPAQSEIMRCRFMEVIPQMLGGQKPDSIRLKSLSILHHLTSNAEHATLLIKHNVAILLCQELVSRPNNVQCRFKALSCMVNLSAVEPEAAHFNQPALLKCLAVLRNIPEIEGLVDNFLHNVATIPKQAEWLRQQGVLSDEMQAPGPLTVRDGVGGTGTRPGDAPPRQRMRKSDKGDEALGAAAEEEGFDEEPGPQDEGSSGPPPQHHGSSLTGSPVKVLPAV